MLVRTIKTSGVFNYAVNRAAFIDKVIVDVKGTRRTRSIPRVRKQQNLAIAGPGRFYARVMRGIDAVAGNGLQLKYGLMRRFENLSPFVLTLWADSRPVTCAGVLCALDSLLRLGHKSTISAVELTFDTESIPVWRFARELCTRARMITEIYNNGLLATLYVGSARSPLQVRIYRKTFSIVRVEFVLRSVFLRAHGIRRPPDLLLLRKVDLWKHVGFHEVEHRRGDELPPGVRKPWLQRGLSLPPAMPAAIVERCLRDEGINPSRWVVSSEREHLLRKMQSNLVW